MPRDYEPGRAQVMVRLSAEQTEGLDRLCEQRGMKRAVLIRALVAGAVKHSQEVSPKATAS